MPMAKRKQASSPADPIPVRVSSRQPVSPVAWTALALVAATGLVYANSLSVPFVYLDIASIRDNPTIRHLWPLSGVLHPPLDQGITVEGRPLVNLSLALNYAVSGPGVWSYHLLNVLIHALAGLALFGIVRRTLGRLGKDCAGAAAGWSGLIWLVHPLQTESVTYTIQRAESLMGCLYLLALYAFIRSVDNEAGARRWQVASVLACLLAMATKEVAVSIPVMVLVYDGTFVERGWREALRRRWGYYAGLAACWIPLGFWVGSTGGNRGGTSGFSLGVSWWAYAQTQFEAIIHYLKLSLWPWPQVFYYEVNWVHGAQVVAPALAVAGLVVASVVLFLRRSPWGFLGLFFFAILAPTSLVPGISQTIAEHRMYLPLAVVVVGLVVGLYRLAERMGIPRGAIAVVLAPAALALGLLTVARNRVYASEVSLWTDTVVKAPGNPYSHNNLGIALSAAGNLPAAVEEFRRACTINPKYAEAQDNLGLALAQSGRLGEAIEHYHQAIALRANYAEARANLGVALFSVGRPSEGLEEFRKAVALDPRYAPTRSNYAAALASVGRLGEAIEQYRTVIAQGAVSAETLYNYGAALAKTGQWAAAADAFRQAAQARPDYEEAHANLGAMLAYLGQWAQAVAAYERALALAPGDADVRENLGMALRRLGREPEAQAQFSAASALRSGH